MKDCCRETYIKTLEEVIILMKTMRGKSMSELYATIQYAIDMMKDKDKEKKKDSVKVFLNEWKDE